MKCLPERRNVHATSLMHRSHFVTARGGGLVRRSLAAALVLAAFAAAGPRTPAQAQTGLTFRYKFERGAGQVWVLGQNARRQLDGEGNGPLGGFIEIWRNGARST